MYVLKDLGVTGCDLDGEPEMSEIEAPDFAWDHPEPFVIQIDVLPDDIDSFRHVNNAVYLRWLTECAWAHSAAVGLPELRCVELRRGMAVRSIQIDLLSPAFLGDHIWVANWLTNKTRLRASRVYQVVRKRDGLTLLRGTVDFVCIDLDSGKPVRMPQVFDEGYQATL